MTATEAFAIAGTVAVCMAIGAIDPAGPASRRALRRAFSRGVLGLALRLNAAASRLLDFADRLTPQDTQRPEAAGIASAERGEGAAPAVVAPSPVALFCGCEVVVDREIVVTSEVALGHYLSRASKAPMVRA